MRRMALGMPVVMVSAVLALAADPFEGTWKRNVTKSTSTLGQVVGQTNTVKAIPGGLSLKFQAVGRDPLEVQYIFDGKPHPGGQGVISRTTGADERVANRLNNHAYEIKYLRQGKVVATTKTELSQDGKTETTSNEGVDTAGKKFRIVWVNDKQ